MVCYTKPVTAANAPPSNASRRAVTPVLGLFALACVAACSGANEAPFAEYPPLSDPPAASDPVGDPGRDGGSSSKDDASAPEPAAGKKIADGAIFFEGVTSDGALVYQRDADLMVWPNGAAAPIRLVQDHSSGEDVLVVRGRFVAVWLGDEIGASSSPIVWAKTGGVQSVAPEIEQYGLYPKAAADEFAYVSPGASTFRRDVWVTNAGGGAGTKIVSGLDVGYPRKECGYTIAYAATGLVVAGCPNGTTTPKVAVHALDGSSSSKTILDGSAPGVFFNRARTHAVVQTSAASSIRSLSGIGAPVPLDGPVVQAVFSADDTKVVYLGADKKVKRAAASSPASPVELAPSALAIRAASPDLRFVVVATKGDLSKNRTDLVAIDVTAPSSARTLVQQNGVFVGSSKSGAQVVYLDDPGSEYADPPLRVAALPAGAPITLSPASARELVADDVVYWQEFVKDEKWNVLKAAKLSSPSDVVTIDEGLDPLTAQMVVVGKKLFVASKLGLWEYPAL